MAKDVWLSPGEALAHLGWNADDKKVVQKLKNALRNRKEFEGQVEERQLNPSFPNKGQFINRNALDAYAANLAQEALAPSRKGGAHNPDAPKVYRVNLTADQANRVNLGDPITNFGAQLYRYQAPKKESTGEPKKRGRKPKSENGVAPEPIVEMELIEA